MKNVFADWIFPDIGDTVRYKKADSNDSSNVNGWVDVPRKPCGVYLSKSAVIRGENIKELDGAVFLIPNRHGDTAWWSTDKYVRIVLTEKKFEI